MPGRAAIAGAAVSVLVLAGAAAFRADEEPRNCGRAPRSPSGTRRAPSWARASATKPGYYGTCVLGFRIPDVRTGSAFYTVTPGTEARHGSGRSSWWRNFRGARAVEQCDEPIRLRRERRRRWPCPEGVPAVLMSAWLVPVVGVLALLVLCLVVVCKNGASGLCHVAELVRAFRRPHHRCRRCSRDRQAP